MKSLKQTAVALLTASLMAAAPLTANAERNDNQRDRHDDRRSGYDHRQNKPGNERGHRDDRRWRTGPRIVVKPQVYRRPPVQHVRNYYPHRPHWNHQRWRAGRWHHGYHGARLGWWWVVGTSWYLYPRAVYPYPEPNYVPATVIAQPAPAAAPAPTQYWYYCASANEYYPYVSSCSEGWEEVPATPVQR